MLCAPHLHKRHLLDPLPRYFHVGVRVIRLDFESRQYLLLQFRLCYSNLFPVHPERTGALYVCPVDVYSLTHLLLEYQIFDCSHICTRCPRLLSRAHLPHLLCQVFAQ